MYSHSHGGFHIKCLVGASLGHILIFGFICLRFGFDFAFIFIPMTTFLLSYTMATKSLLPETGANAITASKTAAPASYEAALQELEQLAAQLESGQLPLDQLMSSYQRGAELLKYCRGKLEAIEQQISVIDGEQLKPWVQE